MDFDRITMVYDSLTETIVISEEIQTGYETTYREIRLPHGKYHWGTVKMVLRNVLGQGLVMDCDCMEEVNP